MKQKKVSFNGQQKNSCFLLINSFLKYIHIYQLYYIEVKPSCMKANSYNCVNCCQTFETQPDYITHYKSEQHRYNVKRKLIGLPPLSYQDYMLQFQPEESSKQSSVQELHCDICSKSFMSAGTYKHHINSKKHKKARERIKTTTNLVMSRESSESGYSFIGGEKAEHCLFCQKIYSKEHMKKQHSFPPFESQCNNFEGLLEFCKDLILEGECLFCQQKFNCQESVKQHMNDVGHNKLNIHNFSKFQKYYLWKIQESSSESEQELIEEQTQGSVFQELSNPTLEDLEEKRLGRISYTPTGVLINGKQVGYRQYKTYYKQYLGRVIEDTKAKYIPAIEGDQKWTEFRKGDKPQKIFHSINCR